MRTILYAYEMDRKPTGRTDSVLWGFYSSIYVTRMADLGRDVASKKNIFKVEVTEDTGDNPPYYAWWDNEDGCFEHVYYARLMVTMCFPYDIKLYEERGDGRLCGVKVKILEVIPPSHPDEKGQSAQTKA